MNKTDIIGSWKLKAFTIESPDGLVKPWRKNATGLLIYTAEDTVSIAMNADLPEGSTDRFDGILFYSGTYEIREPNTIIHHVSNASDKERVGKEMVREAVLNGHDLELTGRGAFGIARVTWERINK